MSLIFNGCFGIFGVFGNVWSLGHLVYVEPILDAINADMYK